MTSRGRSLLVASVVAALLAGGGAALPVPYVVLGPGPTFNTLGEAGGTPLITIEGRETFPTTGNLNLTTVSVQDRVELGTALKDWFDGTRAVVPRALVFPPDQTTEQVQQQNAADMTQSQDAATVVALGALGIAVQQSVTVASVRAGLPADGVLEAGDRILAVDGQAVSAPAQLVDLIRTRKPGDVVKLTVKRGDTTTQRDLTTVADPNDATRAVVGFTPGSVSVFPFTVKIALNDVGGPSAGLMFALGIYDKLTPADLTGGRFVAGTGTIDDKGNVGKIGGIRQKLIAAREKGATVFLVPAGNCGEAMTDPPAGLQLVEVGTFTDALTALAAVRGGTAPVACPGAAAQAR